jgi:hypothetical protein
VVVGAGAGLVLHDAATVWLLNVSTAGGWRGIHLIAGGEGGEQASVE